jgi:hypothetical protein
MLISLPPKIEALRVAVERADQDRKQIINQQIG